MGCFAADMKSAKWKDIPESAIKILKLEHLFLFDEMQTFIAEQKSGAEKKGTGSFSALQLERYGITCFSF